jgi:hypothetical protein
LQGLESDRRGGSAWPFDELAGDIQPMFGLKKQDLNPPLILNTTTGEPSGDD